MQGFKLFSVVLASFLSLIGVAQVDFPSNGARSKNNNHHAFTNATIHVDAVTTIQNGTLLIQNGKVKYVGVAKKLPANTPSVAEQSSSLADKVLKGSDTREEKKNKLQDMIDKGLPVPEWMIQAYELTPKSD